MTITLSGIVHGRRIDLDADAPVPDGAAVTVRLESRRLTADERRQAVFTTAGSWRDDASLDAVFAEIARRRER
ncbi:MAG: hypothetical protein HY699_12345 [Deltaproteobacteria bacterium]|nr:hypothetical protein [Deltaproteobacteria bacterium]